MRLQGEAPHPSEGFFWKLNWSRTLYKSPHSAALAVTPPWPIGGKCQQLWHQVMESRACKVMEHIRPNSTETQEVGAQLSDSSSFTEQKLHCRLVDQSARSLLNPARVSEAKKARWTWIKQQSLIQLAPLKRLFMQISLQSWAGYTLHRFLDQFAINKSGSIQPIICPNDLVCGVRTFV